MTESAEAAAANVSSRRHGTIEITNLTNNYCLIKPNKISTQPTGSVGVLTYDLFERNRNDYIETLAIMFSVPWDYNLYKNWFAVGLTVYSLELSKGEVVICERRIHPGRKISETSEQDIICGICESSS
ncbi:actinoporin-like protein [Pimephales promelas]|nr:actinoporin-like protein [Pimephales promelas]